MNDPDKLHKCIGPQLLLIAYDLKTITVKQGKTSRFMETVAKIKVFPTDSLFEILGALIYYFEIQNYLQMRIIFHQLAYRRTAVPLGTGTAVDCKIIDITAFGIFQKDDKAYELIIIIDAENIGIGSVRKIEDLIIRHYLGRRECFIIYCFKILSVAAISTEQSKLHFCSPKTNRLYIG